MNTCYFSGLCPDTAPFVAVLDELGIDYELVNITASMKNLKRFLVIRDREAAFDEGKAQGFACVPVLATDGGDYLFTPEAVREYFAHD